MRVRTSCAVYVFGAVAAMAGTSAWAQSAPAAAAPGAETVAEVVVTGSHIKRRDYTSDTPIATADQQLVASSGQATLEASLNTLPQLTPSAGASASFVPNGGQANLDLRGMGTQRTLVLLNGRRLEPSLPNGTADVNIIPSALVDNVEVITGGASAVYGSDAIAGVVNIKLKQHFTGLELDVNAGETTRGDGATRGVTVTLGSDFADGRGSGFLSLDYQDRDAVAASSRSYLRGWALSTNVPSGDVIANASNLPSTAVINSVFSGYGVAPGTVKNNSSLQLSTNPDGTLFAIGGAINYKGPVGSPLYIYTTAGDHSASAAQLGLVVAAQDLWLAQTPLKKYSLFSHSDYKLTDSVTLYAEGLYTHYDTITQQNPAVIGSSCCTQISVPVTNPFIPADLKTILASRPNPNANFSMTSPLFAFGPRQDHNVFDVYQFTLGAKGSLAWQDMTWEVYGSHGYMGFQDTLTGYASLAAFNTLLSAPGGGTGICTGGYNPFGVNPLSVSCLRYLGRTGHNNTVLQQDVIEGDAQGKLFRLPAGDARFAVGVDYRRNSYRLDVDSIISSGDFANTPTSYSTFGSTDVKEIYLELLAPVVHDVAFAKEINLDAGYRYSDYNITGGVSTYKIDADWKVVDWLTLRGGYARATRAPSVGDLFQGITGSQVSIGSAGQFASGDPCDASGAYLNPAKNPDYAKVQALCTAQGTPTGFTNNQPRPPSTTQGNINLKPETANTFSVGTVLRPTFSAPLLSRISLSIDYYSIDVKNTMGTVGANAILDNCYTASTNPTYSLNNPYCQLVSRSSTTGLIANISNPLLNLGEYKTSGVDVQADWAAPVSAFGLPDRLGTVSLNLLLNYLDRFTIQSTPTSPVLDFAGTIGNTQVDTYADAHPKWKATTTLGWEIGPVRSNFRWRYMDGMKNFAFVGTTSTGPGAPAVSYFDLDVAWKVRHNLVLRAGMTNIFDKAPPVLPFMSAGTDLYTYDIIGRRVYMSLKANF
ncbi:TonB-dependent receptor domain-containing protein [Caulobacter sp. KR2-114]|uniref:TonB-dependent receptor domain-containing protein n=1 Tax=Caulobacter sp. KR2-114 TaxID=3400912 RepID=UPI003C0046F4